MIVIYGKGPIFLYVIRLNDLQVFASKHVPVKEMIMQCPGLSEKFTLLINLASTINYSSIWVFLIEVTNFSFQAYKLIHRVAQCSHQAPQRPHVNGKISKRRLLETPWR